MELEATVDGGAGGLEVDDEDVAAGVRYDEGVARGAGVVRDGVVFEPLSESRGSGDRRDVDGWFRLVLVLLAGRTTDMLVLLFAGSG